MSSGSSSIPNLSNDKDKIREALKIQDFVCPKKGFNYPCVICKECAEMDLKQFFLKNGLVERTRNSSLISLLLDIKDPFDDMLLKRLSKSLHEKTGIVQKEPEPGFSITFYFTSALLEKVENKEQLVEFIADFQHIFLAETISAKGMINKWERATTKRLSWEMGIKY